jgi:O6-methylguanine-DNA--protein-cysteine methyltransferase
METDRKWIVIRIDGKLAGISRDYDRLAEISARIAEEHRLRDASGKKRKTIKDEPLLYLDIQAAAMDFGQVLKLRQESRWEDLMLFGTDFQKRVWKKLWELLTDGTDENSSGSTKTKLLSYTDFAELCDNRAGVRAIAHAVGLNPLPVVIPCHLIVPKEAIDRIEDIRRKAESTIFRGEDLCTSAILEDPAIDFGEYALGKELKRHLIQMDLQ